MISLRLPCVCGRNFRLVNGATSIFRVGASCDKPVIEESTKGPSGGSRRKRRRFSDLVGRHGLVSLLKNEPDGNDVRRFVLEDRPDRVVDGESHFAPTPSIR